MYVQYFVMATDHKCLLTPNSQQVVLRLCLSTSSCLHLVTAGSSSSNQSSGSEGFDLVSGTNSARLLTAARSSSHQSSGSGCFDLASGTNGLHLTVGDIAPVRITQQISPRKD